MNRDAMIKELAKREIAVSAAQDKDLSELDDGDLMDRLLKAGRDSKIEDDAALQVKSQRHTAAIICIQNPCCSYKLMHDLFAAAAQEERLHHGRAGAERPARPGQRQPVQQLHHALHPAQHYHPRGRLPQRLVLLRHPRWAR